MRLHPFIQKLSYQGVRDILYYSNYVFLPKDSLRYKENSELREGRVYLILSGRIVLHQNDLGAI